MFGFFKGKSGGDRPGGGPDFSHVDSADKARAMAANGELEALLLLPEAFGGDDGPHNVVYVPVGFSALKAQTDENVVATLAAEGRITRYSATPRYTGRSHVPVAIDIVASDPGRFELTINIWGEALTGT